MLISASLLVAAGRAPATTTITETTTSISTQVCSEISPIYQTGPLMDGFIAYVSVPNNATLNGLFNATLTGYSGSARVYSACFVGLNVGEIYFSPHWTSVTVTAQKMEANPFNLTIFGNGVANSTIAPYGSVSVSTVPAPLP